MEPPGFRLEPLGRHHDRATFSCGEPDLARYLRQRPRQDADRYVASVYVLVAIDSGQIAGYFTLSTGEVKPTDVPPELARRQPRYPALPVTLLGRLAVDWRWQGKGIGRALLMQAFRISFAQSLHVAAMAIIVDVLNDRARSLSARHEFQPLITDERRTILPMTAVARLLGPAPALE